MLYPSRQRLATDKNDPSPIGKSVDRLNDVAEIGWREPAVVFVAYRPGQAKTLIRASGGKMLAARFRSSTDNCFRSQSAFQAA